jgi:Putative DNA-binding domain
VNSIVQLLKSDDPLSPDALSFLVTYREEDSLIDYKETFHPDQEKDWLEITKDIIAFANTQGGYLVFGVRDGSFEVVGLNQDIAAIITNTNCVLQKVNRFVEPEICLLRSKLVNIDGNRVVVLLIPQSVGRTHVILKDGKFKHISGEEKVLLRKGTLYVRRSAGNHLADSRDLDDIFNRRLEQFRESLIDRIARVIDAPQESEIVVVSKDASTETAKRFIISNEPDAIPVKGMSFSTAPETPEQAVASWIAISLASPKAVPDYSTLWEWYGMRKGLRLPYKQRIEIAKFCLLRGVPVFYWLQGANAEEIKEMLIEVISRRITATRVSYILAIGCFLGRSVHKALLAKLKDYASRLDQKVKSYPQSGPRSLVSPALIGSRKRFFKGSEAEFQADLETELDKIASGVLNNDEDTSDVLDLLKAQAYDCYLYAQDDQYTKSRLELNEALPTAAAAT